MQHLVESPISVKPGKTHSIQKTYDVDMVPKIGKYQTYTYKTGRRPIRRLGVEGTNICMHRSIDLSIELSINQSMHRSIHGSMHRSNHQSIHGSIYPAMTQSIDGFFHAARPTPVHQTQGIPFARSTGFTRPTRHGQSDRARRWQSLTPPHQTQAVRPIRSTRCTRATHHGQSDRARR